VIIPVPTDIVVPTCLLLTDTTDQAESCAYALDPSDYERDLNQQGVYLAVLDTGASNHLLVNEELFDELLDLPDSLEVSGISGKMQVTQHGHFRLQMISYEGEALTIEGHAMFIPGAARNLLSVQRLVSSLRLSQCRGAPSVAPYFTVSDTHLVLKNLPGVRTFTIPLDGDSNLPLARLRKHRSTADALLCATDFANQNLTEPQKELLRWHFKIGHLSFQSVRLLLRRGILATSEAMKSLHRRAAKADSPKCASCQYGKQRRTTKPGQTHSTDSKVPGAIVKEKLIPGQRIFVDHFKCSTPGRLTTGYGKTPTHEMYSGGSLWIDAASSVVYVAMQVSLDTHETLLAKHKFEAFLLDLGYVATEYVSDGGTAFTSHTFSQNLREHRQVQVLAAPGAHHHNGVAERAIGTIMAMARTMMLHSAVRWPEVNDPTLWPLAVNHAVFLYNHIPRGDNGLAPLEILTRSSWSADRAQHLHVWGCPTYILDPKLQGGDRIPKWRPCSRRGVYMGVAENYATSSPLVLNLQSGAI
jgi:transposase InsO family protein